MLTSSGLSAKDSLIGILMLPLESEEGGEEKRSSCSQRLKQAFALPL